MARPVLAVVRPAVRPRRFSPLELSLLSRRDAFLDLALVILVTLLVPFGLNLVAAFWTGAWALDESFVPLLAIEKWFDVLLAGGLLAYLGLRHRLSPLCFGLRRDRPGAQALWTLASLGTAYFWLLATVVGITVLVLFHPPLEQDLMRRTEMIEALPTRDYWLAVLLLVPVAIHEEVVFRGLLLPYLRRVCGSWTAAVTVSCLIFAALHIDQGWLGVVQVLGVGAAFAVFFILSRSLIAVIVAHFVFNFIQLQLMRLLPAW